MDDENCRDAEDEELDVRLLHETADYYRKIAEQAGTKVGIVLSVMLAKHAVDSGVVHENNSTDPAEDSGD